ncbi:cupin domain-containing protein [Micromonospora zamorensis]|uniref:cupin domain-containing protein n=1 Tax=Micromonospora zamorensis TaxID=709883 RepID=UPI002E1979B7|nr:cupin domain-containing protein [Micromonospora zamorensis]
MSGKDRPEGISPTAVEAAPGLWRVDLQKHDLSIPGREVVQSRVEFTPDSPPFKHFHPGEEIICVLQGSLEYTLEGQSPMVCNVGDALTVPYGVHHQARNVGDGVAVELATYVVEKGKPLLTRVD